MDFTVSYEGDTFYWEHLGMLSIRVGVIPPQVTIK